MQDAILSFNFVEWDYNFTRLAFNRNCFENLQKVNYFIVESDTKPVIRGKHEFIPVDEREFLTVSELVRGRAKLQDVNKVWWKRDHAKL